MTPVRKVGVFGGTFDPIHVGHLVAADETRRSFGLDQVLVLPNRVSPHKDGDSITAAAHRVAMVEIAIESNPDFVLDLTEANRPEPSFAVNTMRQLRADRPNYEFYFILGSDALSGLPRWHDPDGFVAENRIIVMNRAGAKEALENRNLDELRARFPDIDEHLAHVRIPQIEISSSEIRRRVASGISVRYLVPDEVAAYIDDNGLYRS